jgi:DNA replication protein DnaC
MINPHDSGLQDRIKGFEKSIKARLQKINLEKHKEAFADGVNIATLDFETLVNMSEEELEKIKRENSALIEKRACLLKKYGIPENYTDVKYECKECSDSGFIGINMCRCMKEKLVLAGYESSGIGALIRSKNFENFDPDLQRDKNASENASMIFAFCKKYAESYENGASNLLFIGGTGLGKTHLSTAIAGKVISLGYDVVCETAQNLFSDFEFERFNRPYNRDENEESRTDRYFDCDMLIIDDLGTEMTNQFTVSCLYNIINSRLNKGKTVIINTNLTRDELKKRYSDRITSRLFGEFLPVMFIGRDMRELKLD